MPDNGQVERMNRTIKDATVKRYHYDSHDQLRTHLHLFVDAYNHGRRLKTLRGLTPNEFIQRLDQRARSLQDRPVTPHPGPYIYLPRQANSAAGRSWRGDASRGEARRRSRTGLRSQRHYLCKVYGLKFMGHTLSQQAVGDGDVAVPPHVKTRR